MWIFFNRHTQILDTTTSEPGFSKINTDREYTAIKYEFSSFEDINQYWTNLQRICIYTKLGYRRPRDENEPERLKELRFVSTVTFDEAPSHDNGQVPGDHLGAAGFSRTLFAHSFRNWSWLFHGGTKPKSSRTANSRISKITYPTNKATRKRQRRAGNVVAAIKKVPLQSTSGVVKSVVRVRKSGPRDAIDRDALKNMRTLRTKWCSEEDNILKIARAVYVYMAAPVTVLGLLTVGKICRDIIRHHLGITNKTSQACCRRLQFLIKNKRHVPQVPNWLHLLQSNAQIQKRFGDTYLDRLKQCFKNRSEFSNALTLHFIEIFIFLYKHINKLNENVRNHQFIIPNSLPEFQKLFYERKDYNGEADEDSVCNFNENPRSDIQVDVALLYNVLHSSLCCVRDKSLYTMQAFDIYKNYSEETLHTTFQKARTDNLVVALKRKSMQLLRSQYAGPTYLLSSRYKLRLRFLSIPYIVYDTFYAYFEKCLPCLFGENRKYLELKSPQLGQLFFIAEGLTRNFWACNIKLPSNILTIDAEQQRQSESSMDKILDHYHSIFENAPHTEYAKNLENFAENSEKQVFSIQMRF